MLTARETTEIKRFVTEAYASDLPLLRQWHVVSGTGLESCVNNTVSALRHDTFSDFRFYVVEEGEKFVGYFGVEADGNYLTTIFILPDQRGRKKEFWALLLPYLQPEFRAAIYSKNVPCVRFYEKMGKVVNKFYLRDKELTLFKFERGA